MVLHMEDVSLIKGEKWILQHINWSIHKGDNWVLFGLNGAGKTALLNIVNAYYFPTKGKVSVLGREFGKDPIGGELRKHIGFVSSSLQQKFHPGDNAFEVVLSGAYASIGLYETPTDEVREKAITLLKELGCIHYANRNYENLSQGEKQRVLIARSLMANPSLLILDEPTNGLDFIAREEFLETIEEIAKREHAPTMVYVTHHVEEILPIFNKTLLLKEGYVFSAGDTNEMISSSKLSHFLTMDVEVIWKNGRPLVSKRTASKNCS
ncbi:ABC transporter ATP-binding protein [Robertmurraya sp.]|jgi:iron complex transport system ATP-binding protein|uniref:ABC transporter ATP-binding protein n=1 Tax=Robertmurraya sp. TaxID=2837525 RepID=UPI0037044EF4